MKLRFAELRIIKKISKKLSIAKKLRFVAFALGLIGCLSQNQAFASVVKTFSSEGFAIDERTPAFALLIVKKGKTLFKDARGCARFDKKKKCVLKASLDTAFSICSVSKHFTAAAILLLEEDKKLSTDDEIRKYVDLPEKFKGITLKHLIFHTSGIPDYFPIDIEGMAKERKQFTSEDVIKKIINLDLKPFGVAWSYSNSAYVLLGRVIEKVSHQTYEEFLTERIFKKLDMKNTFVHTSIKHQKGYTFQYSPWPILREETWPQVTQFAAEGGIWTSINDYEKWINAFDNLKIFSKKETMDKFLSRGKLDNGSDIIGDRGQKEYNYGFGLGRSETEYKGKKYNIISHGGGMPGTASLFSKLLDQNIWVVDFNNNATYPTEFELLEKAGVTLD